MTSDELKTKIQNIKCQAFDSIWISRNISPAITGHKSLEHRAWANIQHFKAEIEKLITKYERDNP